MSGWPDAAVSKTVQYKDSTRQDCTGVCANGNNASWKTTPMVELNNSDPVELGRFGALASRWWDPDGEFRTLHQINPARTSFVERHVTLAGAEVVDIGCGGGILSEALAGKGAHVTGIDLAPSLLEVARLHGLESGHHVTYREVSVEALAAERPGDFDAVTCMELLEHVPQPDSVVAACAKLLKPGGMA